MAGARPWFARRLTLWLAALGGAVLCLPAVSTGFQLDDYRYIQTFMGTGWSVPTWLERFSWLEPFGDVGSGIDVVGLPWLADPGIQSSLYRP